MSIQVINRVLQSSRTTSPIQQLVLVIIADYCRTDDGGGAFPSVPTIAKRSKLTPRSVTRVIGDLVRCGDLAVVTRGDGRASTRYQVLLQPEGVTERHPRQSVTPDTVSPLGRQSVTPAPTECHPRGDTVSSDPLLNRSLNRKVTAGTVLDISKGRKTPVPSLQLDLHAARFDRVQKAYPTKIGKKPARLEWDRIKPPPDDAATDRILAAIERHKREQWSDTDPKFIPHLRTWLHQARWEDELPGAVVAGGADDSDLAKTDRLLASLRGGR